jgi:hypothetical protein
VFSQCMHLLLKDTSVYSRISVFASGDKTDSVRYRSTKSSSATIAVCSTSHHISSCSLPVVGLQVIDDIDTTELLEGSHGERPH